MKVIVEFDDPGTDNFEYELEKIMEEAVKLLLKRDGAVKDLKERGTPIYDMIHRNGLNVGFVELYK